MKKPSHYAVVTILLIGIFTTGGFILGRKSVDQGSFAASIYNLSTFKNISGVKSPSGDSFEGIAPTDPTYQSWILTRNMCRKMGGTVVQVGRGWWWMCEFIAPPQNTDVVKLKAEIQKLITPAVVPATNKLNY